MLNMMFGQSKYFVDNLSENTKCGQRQKCRLGWYLGIPPLGYMNDVRTKTIAVDKRISKVITQAFELYATGTYSIADISEFFARSRIKTATNKNIGEDEIKRMLTNPFYRGIFTYSGENWEGKHKLFISQGLFDKVQAVIKLRGYNRKKQYKFNPHAFCGLLRCANCGQMVTGEHLVRKNKNGKTCEYTYYHCSRTSKYVKCKKKAISEANLDAQISDLLRKYSMPKK